MLSTSKKSAHFRRSCATSRDLQCHILTQGGRTRTQGSSRFRRYTRLATLMYTSRRRLNPSPGFTSYSRNLHVTNKAETVTSYSRNLHVTNKAETFTSYSRNLHVTNKAETVTSYGRNLHVTNKAETVTSYGRNLHVTNKAETVPLRHKAEIYM